MRNSAYPLCRHTKTDGHLCRSPALATSAFCHFHQKLRRTSRSTLSAGPGLSTHVLHPLQDSQSILRALSMVLTGIAANRIHPKIAGKMLYALQTATTNLRKAPEECRF
jgi:hypothetical protein